MMARVKTIAKYRLDTTVHGLNKGCVVVSEHRENKEALSWRKWGKHTSLSGNLFFFFCKASAAAAAWLLNKSSCSFKNPFFLKHFPSSGL